MTTEAQKRAIKKWKLNNPQKVKESNIRCAKRYYKKNKESIKARVSAYSKTKIGMVVAKKAQKKFNENNQERVSEIKKNSREKNRLNYNKYQAEYMRKPEIRAKHIVYNQNRINKIISDGTITPKAIKSIYVKQNGKCAISGKSLEKGYHIDHIIPVSKKGRHTITNIQLLFPSINLRKSNKLNFSL